MFHDKYASRYRILNFVLFKLITSRIKFIALNLPKSIEELKAYEVKIASKRQEHNVRYAQVESFRQVHQTGVMLTDLLPEPSM
jgi:hypothetical protein